MTQSPPPPRSLRAEIPEALEAIILRCLEKDRDRRFSSMAELAAAIAPFRTVGATIAEAPSAIVTQLLAHGSPSPQVEAPAIEPKTEVSIAPKTLGAVSIAPSSRSPSRSRALYALAGIGALSLMVGGALASRSSGEMQPAIVSPTPSAEASAMPPKEPLVAVEPAATSSAMRAEPSAAASMGKAIPPKPLGSAARPSIPVRESPPAAPKPSVSTPRRGID